MTMVADIYIVHMLLMIVLRVNTQPVDQPDVRQKRGLLSRTGLCPASDSNYQIKDQRLNFYGQAYYLPPDRQTMGHECEESDCDFDYQCHANRRCCQNVCGARVCTEATRDAHPCSMFNCPPSKVCKLQRVRCIQPDCPDLYALPRPVCVTANSNVKRARIYNSLGGEPFAYIYPIKPFYHPEIVARDDVAGKVREQEMPWPYNKLG